ncbi:MAG: hypothetical protein G01um101433_403 [Parcubacteria group bacterium Gr01-1014_33]|nr:MAG: hypothetical protein G01um101433_403 [Parcubacteria group bacterium Gr01-1014_33]
MRKNSPPKIVVIGGGTGVFTALSGLKQYPVDLTAIVSSADDGGPNGVLREEFGILPPGDMRKALLAMAFPNDQVLFDLFNYRFQEGRLKGYSCGSIILTALERITGDFPRAIKEAGRLLGVRGEVLPVARRNARLFAELEDGTVIRGETNIDIPKHDGKLKIINVWLEPAARANREAIRAIRTADVIVIGPGDLYTSIIPNFLVKGIPRAIKKSRGRKVYVTNIMTKWGETHGFAAADFTSALEKYLGKDVLDYVCINTTRPSASRRARYEHESSECVEKGELDKNKKYIFGNFIRSRGFIRHDPDRLAQVLLKLVK